MCRKPPSHINLSASTAVIAGDIVVGLAVMTSPSFVFAGFFPSAKTRLVPSRPVKHAQHALAAYEQARAEVASFLGSGSPREVVFTYGTASAINRLASSLGERFQAALAIAPETQRLIEVKPLTRPHDNVRLQKET